MMLLPIALTALALAAANGAAAAAGADDKKAPPLKPCTIRSGPTGNFFDVSALRLEPAKNRDKPAKGEAVESWHARGYDYGANFTLNFCAPVVEEVKDVDGVESAGWKNVSAYYQKGGKTYSMGFVSLAGGGAVADRLGR
jgi:cation-dependent mannose-6-phosphate receptor